MIHQASLRTCGKSPTYVLVREWVDVPDAPCWFVFILIWFVSKRVPASKTVVAPPTPLSLNCVDVKEEVSLLQSLLYVCWVMYWNMKGITLFLCGWCPGHLRVGYPPTPVFLLWPAASSLFSAAWLGSWSPWRRTDPGNQLRPRASCFCSCCSCSLWSCCKYTETQSACPFRPSARTKLALAKWEGFTIDSERATSLRTNVDQAVYSTTLSTKWCSVDY